MTPDKQHLQRLLDQVKAKIFMGGDNSAFLGSLMCSLKFGWREDIPTARTDGVHLWWNPHWFLKLPLATRVTVMLHELWHCARLHMIRCGERDPKLWNDACDYRINNDLDNEKNPKTGDKLRSFEGTSPLLDHSIDAYGILSEEQIYQQLLSQAIQAPAQGTWGEDGEEGDIEIPTVIQKNTAIANVVRAIQQAELAKQAGTLPGDIKTILDEFLDPMVPWELALQQFHTDLLDEDYYWRRPNRRYQDEFYMPSREPDEGKLAHLAYFFDVSGSMTENQRRRVASEIKYIQEVVKPTRLTLLQFDTRITFEKDYTEDEPFTELEVTGGGGTCLRCVHEWIEKNRPIAAVIFSDMEVKPMEPLTVPTEILWCSVNNPDVEVPFGKLIHVNIRED